MKRLFAAAFLLVCAVSAHAGIAYEFESVTTGLAASRVLGKVQMEGANVRIDFERGDGMLFKNGSVVLSSDGGRTLRVIDPIAKTYYELSSEALFASNGVSTFTSAVKLKFSNPKANVRNIGRGTKMEGFDTRRVEIDMGYDATYELLDKPMKVRTEVVTESWVTDQLSGEFTNFLQMRGMRSGVEAIDRVLAAHSSVKGFPLKQVSRIRVVQNGSEVRTMTTSNVRRIEHRAIAPARFAMPTGYVKVFSPLEKMLKQFGL